MWYFIGGAVLVILVIIFVNKAKKPSAALYDAIRDGDHERLARILKRTSVKALARTRHNDFLSRLLENENLTPMQYACAVGDLETVRMLIDAGGNLNAPMRSYDWGNPLWYANHRRQDRDRFKVRLLLVEAGANCTESKNVMQDILLLYPEELEDEEICRDQLELFKKVYELNESALGTSMPEARPELLRLAARQSGVPVVKFLIEKGYPVNPEVDPESGHTAGDTPLCSAASGGYVPNVEYLLSVGADIGLRNDENKTALEVVVDKRKRIETEDWLKHERDRLDDFDRVIESMKEAAGK